MYDSKLGYQKWAITIYPIPTGTVVGIRDRIKT